MYEATILARPPLRTPYRVFYKSSIGRTNNSREKHRMKLPLGIYERGLSNDIPVLPGQSGELLDRIAKKPTCRPYQSSISRFIHHPNIASLPKGFPLQRKRLHATCPQLGSNCSCFSPPQLPHRFCKRFRAIPFAPAAHLVRRLTAIPASTKIAPMTAIGM